MKIDTILADYDGTLCPCSVNTRDSTIPERLNDVLLEISEKIPVCIVSSKDFGFLHKRIKFANIFSCILGIETLHLKKHLKVTMMTATKNAETTTATTTTTADCNNFSCITDHHLIDDMILQHNSRTVDCLANDILLNFKDVTIERKYISNNQILAGITIDWRHLQDWESFKKTSEPLIKKQSKSNKNYLLMEIPSIPKLMLHILSLMYMQLNVIKAWHLIVLPLKFPML
jgi:hypothetical protein